MKPNSGLGARPTFSEDDLPAILASIAEVLRSGRLILGHYTESLEQEFAQYVGVRHAVAVSSCSAALEIALRSIGAGGREVIVPSNTFVATATAALRATAGITGREIVVPTNTCAATASAAHGTAAGVVLCESDPDGNFSVEAALDAMNERTAAVVVVHVAGFVVRDFDRLLRACSEHGVAVIEDCAHAHGATHRDRRVGSLGDAGCFSFYPTKIMTCGVGGMLTTDSDAVAATARSLRHHGRGASIEEIVAIGSDWLMDEVRAVLARAQLRRLGEVITHRRLVAATYDALLAGTEFTPIVPAPDTVPVYYKYPVQLPAGVDRDAVRRLLRERGIEAGVLYWPPVHRMPIYAPLGIAMPRTEEILRRRLCLPMHAQVDPADCGEIVEALKQAVAEVRA